MKINSKLIDFIFVFNATTITTSNNIIRKEFAHKIYTLTDILSVRKSVSKQYMFKYSWISNDCLVYSFFILGCISNLFFGAFFSGGFWSLVQRLHIICGLWTRDQSPNCMFMPWAVTYTSYFATLLLIMFIAWSLFLSDLKMFVKLKSNLIDHVISTLEYDSVF